jgi:phospholipid-binding lipoprotein MlaA
MNWLRWISFAALAGCTVPGSEGVETQGINDPLEGMNRCIFAFNQAFDDCIINPLLFCINTVLPGPVRKGLHNVISTAGEPSSMINCLLQCDLDNFLTHLGRLFINVTVGVGGLIDVAGMMGISPPPETFTKTLKKVADVGPGFFIVVPLIGPSTTRDSLARLVDTFLCPATWNGLASAIYYPAEYLDLKEQFKDPQKQLAENFGDPYAVLRTIYYQRQGDLKENTSSNESSLDDDDSIFSVAKKMGKKPVSSQVSEGTQELFLLASDMMKEENILLDEKEYFETHSDTMKSKHTADLTIVNDDAVTEGDEEMEAEISNAADRDLFPGIDGE